MGLFDLESFCNVTKTMFVYYEFLCLITVIELITSGIDKRIKILFLYEKPYFLEIILPVYRYLVWYLHI